MKYGNIKNIGHSLKYSKCNNLLLYNYKYNNCLFQSESIDFNSFRNDNLAHHANNQGDK